MSLTKLEAITALAFAQVVVEILAVTRGYHRWPALAQAVARRDAVALVLASIVVFAGCVLLSHRRDGVGTLGLAGTSTLGAVFAVVAAGEPAAWHMLDLRTYGLPGSLIAGLTPVLLALVPVLGIQELTEQRLDFMD